MGLRSLALTSKSLRLLVRRKATRGVALKTLVQRGDEDRMLKCLSIMDDTERRAGLYVTTRGTRIGWLVSEVSFVAIASERNLNPIILSHEKKIFEATRY